MRKSISLLRLYKLAAEWCISLGEKKGKKMMKIVVSYLKYVAENKDKEL